MSDDHYDENTDQEPHGEEVGIPQSARVKRKYTMSAAALQQRRDAAKQPKPGMEGVRNAFKHGRYASSFLSRIKPCKSTCAKYPCQLIEDNRTAPGGDCLDAEELLEIIKVVHDAIRDPKNKAGGFREVAAVNIGNSIRILEMLHEDIIRDGSLVKEEIPGKYGTTTKYKLHPALLALPKMIQDLNLTPDQFMITPKAQAKVDGEKEAAKTIGELLGAAGKQLAQAKATKKEE